jgi:exonuclease SbcC
MENVSESSVEDDRAIMTRGTKDSFSEITFSVNGITYQSHWSVRLTRNGTPDKIKLKISRKEGDVFQPLTDKVSESKAAIVKIIGLTKEQFTQGIVLSQGKFDEFLRAKNHERYELLEIITGTSLFREIGIAANQRFKDIQQQIRQHAAILENVRLLSAEEILQLETELSELDTAKLKLLDAQTVLNKLKDTKQRIEELNRIMSDIDNELKRIVREHDAHAKELNAIREDMGHIYEASRKLSGVESINFSGVKMDETKFSAKFDEEIKKYPMLRLLSNVWSDQDRKLVADYIDTINVGINATNVLSQL